MLRHFKTFWNSVDYMALIKGWSSSRLAINGNLDATAFNPCKRYTKYEQPHWISSGSLVAAIDGAGMTLLDFAVIYQILYTIQTDVSPDLMQEIMADMTRHMQTHIDRLAAPSHAPAPGAPH